MSLRSGLLTIRSLTPLGWLAAAVAAGVALVTVVAGLGFRWDPFDLTQRRFQRATAAADRGRAEARARSAEAIGQAGQVARLDAAAVTLRVLERVTAHSIAEARNADEAFVPLPQARADRLRDHDRKLCGIAPDLGGCSTAVDPPADGQPPL